MVQNLLYKHYNQINNDLEDLYQESKDYVNKYLNNSYNINKNKLKYITLWTKAK